MGGHDPELPPPWRAHTDPTTHATYYYNDDTKETTWIRPTTDNMTSTSNSGSGDAEVLPSGWMAYTNEDGVPYYHHQKHNRTTWSRPCIESSVVVSPRASSSSASRSPLS